MGDISVIARRLSTNYVQYGWSGNGGYFSNVGARLLQWYDDPSLVDYLFGLGQLKMLGKPGSEKGGESWFDTHMPTGEQHWEDSSERSIFSKIAYVDYGYFYDSDNIWYYVGSGPFRIKIPLWYIAKHLDKSGDEFEERSRVTKKVLEYFLMKFVPADTELKEIADSYEKPYDEIIKQVIEADYPDYVFFDHFNRLYAAMDDWVVVKTDEKNENITGIIMKKKQGENRIETIDWG